MVLRDWKFYKQDNEWSSCIFHNFFNIPLLFIFIARFKLLVDWCIFHFLFSSSHKFVRFFFMSLDHCRSKFFCWTWVRYSFFYSTMSVSEIYAGRQSTTLLTRLCLLLGGAQIFWVGFILPCLHDCIDHTSARGFFRQEFVCWTGLGSAPLFVLLGCPFFISPCLPD